MAVVDAGVAAALVLHLPWSRRARETVESEQRLIAPSIFLAEIANAIWKNVFLGKLAPDVASSALRIVRSVVEPSPDETLIDSALELSLGHRHPVYDCLYLALARRENAEILTADRKLAALALKVKIPARLLAS